MIYASQNANAAQQVNMTIYIGLGHSKAFQQG
jgi:hypothetical protein